MPVACTVYLNRPPWKKTWAIHRVYEIEDILLVHGVAAIRKILFHYQVPPGPPIPWFPFRIHNLSLERYTEDPAYFHVVFYHYMDHENQRHEIPQEQKAADFRGMVALLYRSEQLMRLLGDHILHPFQ